MEDVCGFHLMQLYVWEWIDDSKMGTTDFGIQCYQSEKQSFLKVKIPFTTVQLALQTLLPHLVARCTLGYYMVS